MTTLDTIAVLISLAALFSYLNARFIRLPTTIGLMIIALLLSLTMIAMGKLGWSGLRDHAEVFLRGIDFHETLMQGMLSFLLFAGALHVNLADLRQQKWVIGLLASLGVLISTFLVGTLTWWVLMALGSPLPYIYCLVFGALISPTDPIAVLGILKTAGAPKTLETKITGESLFNDGVGVVVFLVLAGIAAGTQSMDPLAIGALFAQEAMGGALFGFVLGWLAYAMLRSIDNYQVEVLITLAVVMGGYALASHLHLSGPIAMVVAGLLIGNRGRRLAMSDVTRDHLDKFWELVDEVLNAALFVLIGLEVLVVVLHHEYLIAALVLIPVVLLARLISVGLPILGLSRFRSFTPGVVPILTWGGLRGGISVALALSLPLGAERDILLSVTYVIVVFSIVVQGMTISRLVRRLVGAGAA
ncbi:MAG TPA: sodium:proton antiporter [Gammaproteobacteria bacterium]|nr:sodium:proton antiporter [Gammaproteobacteria bacterium]